MKNKCALQLALKFTNKNALLLAIAAVALCALPGVALATDCFPQTNWTGTSGSWFDTGNWDNGVPDSGTAAVVDNGGTAKINGSQPDASACSLTLGPTAGHSGNVSVSNEGGLTVTYGIVVGDQGTGSLSVAEGSSVTSTEISIGATSSPTDGIGLLKVTDSGSSVAAASIHVYTSGTLTGNGTVSTTSGTTVDGTLSPKGQLTIGAGNLELTSGGTMVSNVTPQAQDNVNVVSGVATLDTGSKLVVAMSGTFTPGTTYTLLHAENGRNGTFSSVSIDYPTCQCFTPQIQYDANNVKLYLKPVPCCH